MVEQEKYPEDTFLQTKSAIEYTRCKAHNDCGKFAQA